MDKTRESGDNHRRTIPGVPGASLVKEKRPPMPSVSRDSDEPIRPPLGWKAVAAAAAIYAACVSLATWPRVLWFRSALPSLGDPLQHLWIMRWYKTCLWEWRSPVVCPELQYPTGAPLGCFSPLHFQSLLFIPLSAVLPNDVLCYNLVWMFGIVFTGLATFLLAWRTVGDRWCAGFGGMLAMLGGPMMLHALAHLELIYLGGFPLFLWAWLRFVDCPTRGRLAGAVGLYLMLAAIAAYYAVFAIFPAALYVVWKMAARSGKDRGEGPAPWPWLRARAGWFLAFAALVVPGLLVEFGNQLWAMSHGYVFPRSIQEFRIHGAPLWAYAVPTSFQALGRLSPSGEFAASAFGPRLGECGSYLGVVALGLLAYAAVRRARFEGAAYWWSALVLLVVLSGGASWTLGGHELPLPGLWLKQHVFLFRLIRVPARFNLFASVVAAIIAANGLRHLLTRLPSRTARAATFAALAAAALADLAVVPSLTATIPPMPGCYAFMKRADPDGAFVEVPQFGSGGSVLYSTCGYWQAIHRGRTSAGYCGQGNAVFDNLATWNSPFAASRLARADYLADPDRVAIELVPATRFRDYAWLYLTAHRFRFAVLHQWPGSVPELPVRLDRLKAELASARVFDDGDSVVYDRERLPAPTRPVVLTTSGWRPAWDGKMVRVANRSARLALYNPDAGADLRLRLEAFAFQRGRRVRLRAGDRELASWDVRPGPFQTLASPTFQLPAGLHELVLESESDDRPRSWRDASYIGDTTPYSLKVGTLEIDRAPELARREAK